MSKRNKHKGRNNPVGNNVMMKNVTLNNNDIIKIKKDATNIGVQYSLSLMFYVLHKEKGFGAKRLKDMQLLVDEYSSQISRGELNFEDVVNKMKDLGVNFM